MTKYNEPKNPKVVPIKETKEEAIAALPEGKCGSCKFMDIENPAQPFCRRYPAQLVPVNGNLQALYPVVNPTKDWCGEHRLLTA